MLFKVLTAMVFPSRSLALLIGEDFRTWMA